MANINLADTTTLEALFKTADSWANLPVSTLSEEQLALLQLKNSVFKKSEARKGGGMQESSFCFICYTGA